MRHVLIISLILLLAPAVAHCQKSGRHFGAKSPKPDLNLSRDWQYKRVHQLGLRYTLVGRCDEARSYLQAFEKDHPHDEETPFLLGLIDARQDRTDDAVANLKQALELGLPAGRIIAGPRALLEPIRDTSFYQQTLSDLKQTPIHGPLVGATTERSASFWVRTAQASTVRVLVSDANDFTQPLATCSGQSTAESDFTTVVKVSGLEPATDYHYAVQIDDGPLQTGDDQAFRTFPTVDAPVKFRIAFGGGAGYVPENERMWSTIESFNPDALLLLGDNVYIDDPESIEMQRYTYYRRQSRPEWRSLTAKTPTLTIWDDHDFSVNDSWGGPYNNKPDWKLTKSWPIFKQNWANPGYGGGEPQPGCWYAFSIGDVRFIMLDCRYYRTSPKVNEPNMLGPVQMKWLRDELASSTGTFTVVCSSVPWDFRTKGDSLDTWNGYKKEREAIFSFIESQKHIEGVLLMSADRHRSDAWKIERPDGYPFYEFNSSRLTNQHVHNEMTEAIFSYNKKQSFGLVTFDTTAEDPTAKYDVVNIDGKTVHSLTVKRSELRTK